MSQFTTTNCNGSGKEEQTSCTTDAPTTSSSSTLPETTTPTTTTTTDSNVPPPLIRGGRGGRSGTILRGTAPFLPSTSVENSTTTNNNNTPPPTTTSSPSTTIQEQPTSASTTQEQPLITTNTVGAETIVNDHHNNTQTGQSPVQTNLNNTTTTTTTTSNSTSTSSSSEESKPTSSTILDVINDDEALFKLAQERNKNRKRGNPRAAQRHDTQASKIEENDWLMAGYCEFQGTRPSMEDALYCNLSFRTFTSDMGALNETCIGLFDGHGGSNASKQASTLLHSVFLDKLTRYENLLTQYFEDYNSRATLKTEAKTLTKLLRKHFIEKEAQQKLSEEQAMEQFDILRMSSVDAIQLLIRESFLEADELVCEQNSVDGSTATLVYMPTRDSKFLFVGNVGDSRVVLCRDGKPITLTVDHRPSDSDERRRVRDAGKSIINNRISACLAVSRSIGDKTFHPGVISDPHTQAIRLCEKDEFMIIACDGVFDFVSEEEAVREIRDETNPITASLKLRDYAFNKKGSNDNISAIVVRFKRP